MSVSVRVRDRERGEEVGGGAEINPGEQGLSLMVSHEDGVARTAAMNEFSLSFFPYLVSQYGVRRRSARL